MPVELSRFLLSLSGGLVLLSLQSFTSCAHCTEIELRPELARQGETVEVIVKRSPGSTGGTDAAGGATPPAVTFRKKSYRSFPAEAQKGESGSSSEPEVFHLLLGVPADLPPGNYNVESADALKALKVVSAGFGVQSIRLPKGKDNFNATPGEVEAVDAAKATVSPRRYFQGKFLPPSKARTSSPFGLRRRVNGVLLADYFHSGLDFAGASGSPVNATGAGKVLLAHRGWKLHGNTVSIDHGQGVVSFYIHLSRIFVKEGDFVKAGDKIGAVGATGRASGPHLHFSIYVNDTATNPVPWFKKAY